MHIGKLGIIAGRGDLPKSLYQSVSDAFVIGIKGFCTPDWADDSTVIAIAKVGAMVKALKTAGVDTVVLAGAVERPSFTGLIPDVLGVKLISKLRHSTGGDDAILRIIVTFLQDQDFQVASVEDILGQQSIPPQVLTRATPNESQMMDITKGFDILSHQSHLDIGQGVVVQEKIVLAIEAIEGTDAMIARAGRLQRSQLYGAILIKSLKNTQSRDIDLPTVGVDTVKSLVEHGFSGLAISADGVIVLNMDDMIAEANRHGMFIIAV